MIRFSLLGSGSAGNATIVVTPTCKILIDNGLSYKQLVLRLDRVGETLEGLQGIFITHEHTDHVNGAGILARKMQVPVFMTEGTYAALPKSVGLLPKVECFESGDSIDLDGLSVTSFQITHDAADPVSFVVRSGGCQLGLATDLGIATELVRQRLQGSNALILESNYCPKMLRESTYPAAVVQRIGSNQGHLSNPDMNSLLAALIHDDLQWVVAVHISQENNTVEKAREMAARVLGAHPAELFIADQERPSPLFEIIAGSKAASRKSA